MRDRIKASLVVRWDSTSDCYVDARTFTKIKMGFWITLCEVALPFAVVGIAAIISFALAGDLRNAVVLAAETVFIVWAVVESLRSNSAGQRLLDPTRYPKVLTEPAGKRASIENLPKRRKKQAVKWNPSPNSRLTARENYMG